MFSQAQHLKKHIHTIHEGHKDYKCDSCGKLFSRDASLKRHIQTVHEGHQKNQSIDDKKLFFQAYNLENDIEGQIETKIDAIIEESHQVISSYKCKFCHQLFEEYDQLKVHIRDIHLKPDENRILELPISNNIPKLREEAKIFLPIFYQNDSKIETELDDLANEKSIVLDEVKQEFNVNEKIPKKNIPQTIHKKSRIVTKRRRSNRKKYQSEKDQISKNENLVKCEVCNRVFKEPWILKQHQSVYFRKFCKPPKLDNEETEFFNCSSCMFIARRLKGLKAHALNDHFQCYDCNLSFENRENTLNHLEGIHSQTWKCTICNTRYFTGKYIQTKYGWIVKVRYF